MSQVFRLAFRAEWSMDAPLLTDDFKEFLRLLNAHRVEYLGGGGYAVGLHGYPRATVDLDIWIPSLEDNAAHNGTRFLTMELVEGQTL